jgi:hypothetical protein
MTISATQHLIGGVRERLDGQLLLPGDNGYHDARTVWNALVDRHPKVIVRCASTRDAILAVRTARELCLEIGVRCGGHNALASRRGTRGQGKGRSQD